MTLTRKLFGNPEKQVNKKMLNVNMKSQDVNISRIVVVKYLSFGFVVKNEVRSWSLHLNEFFWYCFVLNFSFLADLSSI